MDWVGAGWVEEAQVELMGLEEEPEVQTAA